jgi:hypothetical protein
VPDHDKPKKKKKKRDNKTKEDDDEQGMWVEKPTVIVASLPGSGKPEATPPSTETAQAPGQGPEVAFGPAAPLHKGRKRAIDFM